MLQINTGKFFKNGIGRTNNLSAVLYSNAWMPSGEISTACGSICLTDTDNFPRIFIYNLTENIEYSTNRNFGLISHTATPYQQDFAIVATFGLQSIFSPEIITVDHLTRTGNNTSEKLRKLVHRYFDERVLISGTDNLDFINFVSDLLKLERKSYLSVIRAMKFFVNGLQRIPDDYGLAYTLLISSIESLSPDKKRQRKVTDTEVDNSSVIQTDSYASTGRGFSEFVMKNIEKEFFRETHNDDHFRVTRRELPTVLKAAYKIRSKYIHNNEPVPDGLTIPLGYNEVIRHFDNEYLTFQGLIRLSDYIIRKFVKKGKKVAKELNYNHQDELFGIRKFPLVPNIWIGNTGKNATLRERISGFLPQISNIIFRTNEDGLTDMREVITNIEQKFQSSSNSSKMTMYAIHFLYNNFIDKNCRSKNYSDFLEKHNHILTQQSSENLILNTIFDLKKWELENFLNAHKLYWNERFSKTGIKATRHLEAAIELGIAEMYRDNSEFDMSKKHISDAVECIPNNRKLRLFEQNFKSETTINWFEILKENN